MQHFSSLQDLNLHDAWLTIGSFDGVHIGHQKIIKALTAGASNADAPAVLLTFYPHPAVVLGGLQESFYLTTPEEKALLLGEAGIDIVITHPFDREVASVPAQDFVTRLKDRLGLAHLFVGHDFVLGHNREGDVSLLRKLGDAMGFDVHEIAEVQIDKQVVSSSFIRQLLFDGNIEQANKLLGKPFSLAGEVEPGEGRGHTIGIPTANLAIWKERVTPGSGVYVCRAEVNGKSWQAVANIGVRPTFEVEAAAPTVEAHLLDFDEDIYGQSVRLEFLHRLRGEQKFAGVDELVAQIQADITRAREILSAQEAIA
jgi:riboflavin kinase/FMN adenylyltransferase